MPWLGKIPAHWQILRNGGLFAHRVETGYPDLPILEVSLRTGVTIRDFGNTKRKQVMSQREKYKRARQGDIAYNMMRMWQGAVGVAPVDGLVSPAYVVVRPYAGTDTSYFNCLFGTQAYKAEVNKYSRGIVADRNRLYWDDFKKMSSIVPSLDEQSKIAAFLRTQDRQIAKLIRGKRRLIELLNEQKQTIIHRAVTRGLNPDVPLKPSGVDWLGDVPAHWDILKIKMVATFNPSRSEAESYKFSDQMATFIPMECVTTAGKLANPEIASIEKYWEGYTYFRRNDVVVAKITPCFENGKGACFDCLPTEFGFGTTEFVVLRAHLRILPRFLYQLTALRIFRKSGTKVMTGSAGQQRVPLDFIKNFPVPVPPLNEQRVLLDFIDKEEQYYQQIIDQTANEITLIREYRDRLISDVVTGQIDVCGWQPEPDDENDADILATLSEADENGESLDDEEVSDV